MKRILGLFDEGYNYIKAKILIFIFSFFKIDNHKILVSNFWGKGYGENPAAVIDELLKSKKNYKIYWIADDMDSDNYPKEIIKIKKRTIKYYYHLCTSKVWISNVRTRIEISKRKGQFYIQLWHGSIPLKKIEKDVEEQLNKMYVKAAKNDSKNIDLFISNSDSFSDLCRKSFWYDGRVEKYGSPKNDLIVNKKNHSTITNKIRKEFNISKDEKIILYAPTFRSGYGLDAYDIDFNLVLKEFEKKYKCNFKIFVRMHPNVSKANIEKLIVNDKIINATSYYDINDLLIASDFLITDYSSVMFDYGLMKKPVFLYASDVDKYDRGFYYKISKLPFSCSESNSELSNNIKKFNEKDYLKGLKKFYDDNGIFEDGKASKRVADEILKVTGEKNGKE